MNPRTTPGAVAGATKDTRSPATDKKERPILFSGPLVKAILEGRKTQTRRVMKETPTIVHDGRPYAYIIGGPFGRIRCPYGGPGDRLWVRETFAVERLDGDERIIWRADNEAAWASELGNRFYLPTDYQPAKWRPAIHMSRSQSRIDLEVAAIRVELLHDITGEDAIAEGIDVDYSVPDNPRVLDAERLVEARRLFAELWETINSERAPWRSNPWVWVVDFRVVRPAPGGGQ